VSDLADLRAEVAELREDMQFLLRRLLATDDRRDLVRLLPAAHALLGNQVWSASSLADAAAVSPDGGPLSLLIAENVTERGGLRGFGRLLARLEGAPLGGLRLVRCGTDARHGALYAIRANETFQAPESLPAAGASGTGRGRCPQSLEQPE
jgi:hypothetical protein